MNAGQNLSDILDKTWHHDLKKTLRNAKLGDTNHLDHLLQDVASFAAVSANYSVLLTLRHFDLYYVQEKSYALNCSPNDENFQWGITVTTSSDSADSQYNILLPNNRNYTGLTIENNEVEILMDNGQITQSNIIELKKKLHFLKGFTEQELEDAFCSLSNEKYDEEVDEKPEVKSLLITIPSIGALIYNGDFEWYEGIFTTDEIAFDVNIYNTTPDKLDLLLSFVENQIQTEFYKNMLWKMEPEMIKLKNDSWREKNEITCELEPEITAENFRKRVSIDSIIFNDDCSSQIYCHDDDIFWGLQIQINVDKDGKYLDAGLVG